MTARLRVALVLLAVLGAVAVPAREALAEGQKWALLVGIDQYQRPDIPALRCAVADVRAVADALRRCGGFPADNVFLLTSDQSGDNAPTRGNVAFRLSYLGKRVHSGDTVVFYFSGHGLEMDQARYLMTSDSDPRSAETLQVTGFATADLQRFLKALSAERLLVFLDACRNDPRGGRAAADNLLSAGMARDLTLTERKPAAGGRSLVTATFLACSEGQRSYEWNDKRQGFFSYFLVQGLRGKAADRAGRVTLQRLVEYLEKEVPRATERINGARQVPWVITEGAGLSNVVVSTAGPAGEEDPPAPAALAPTREAPPAPAPARPQETPATAPSPPQARPAAPPAAPQVDPAMVGVWQGYVQINGVVGVATVQVTADGAYRTVWNTGMYQQPRNGRVQAADGRWTIHWDDGEVENGTYRLVGPGALESVSSRIGPVQLKLMRR